MDGVDGAHLEPRDCQWSTMHLECESSRKYSFLQQSGEPRACTWSARSRRVQLYSWGLIIVGSQLPFRRVAGDDWR